MCGNTLSILEGNTFVVSDRAGDIEASTVEPAGLFSWDTRFISRWRLTLDGERPAVLSTDELDDYFSAQFFLARGTGTTYVDPDISVLRKRAVGNGFHEDLFVSNHGVEPVDLLVRLDVGADFADLFEIKDALAKKGEYFHRIDDGTLVLGYRRGAYKRETWITTTAAAAIDQHGFSFAVHIGPREEWHTCLQVDVEISNLHVLHDTVHYQHIGLRSRPDMQLGLEKWHQDAPKVACEWPWLARIYQRSLVDLAALRFQSALVPDGALPAAGLPWFMTIFGRDSLITGLQALPFFPELLETALRLLALHQGMRRDDFREEEPGKILHEIRFGELTAFEERPHSPYYGSADSTPLFLICLDEYERWTGDAGLVRELELEARAALAWIDDFGDRDGDGYVEYDRTNRETGLENQCWKDSWNSILFADGSLSRRPLAVCEIQGYVYDAKMRCARLARAFWGDATLALRLEREAAEFRRRFNRDFWVAGRECFALALDGDGHQVDSLTSNIGHLLWSGIADPDRARACVRHLMGDQLFSGWGVRTMAEGEGGYNPLGYHVGTVWPHDNSIIALGLRRYGYGEEAAQIALAMLEAARFFEGRLPEAFAGYARNRTGFPVEYPTACSPQAWAAGTPLLLVRAMLGLEPEDDRLAASPAVPASLGQLCLSGITGRWGRADVRADGTIAVPESLDHLERLMV